MLSDPPPQADMFRRLKSRPRVASCRLWQLALLNPRLWYGLVFVLLFCKELKAPPKLIDISNEHERFYHSSVSSFSSPFSQVFMFSLDQLFVWHPRPVPHTTVMSVFLMQGVASLSTLSTVTKAKFEAGLTKRPGYLPLPHTDDFMFFFIS